MADPTGIPPPILYPSLSPDYAEMQRRQQIAQMLMSSLQNQQAQPATPGPSGLAIVPRRGWMQNLAPVLTAALAGNAQNKALEAQQNYLQKLNGGGQAPAPNASAGPSLAPPPADPNAQSVEPFVARNGRTLAQALGPQPQPQQPAQNPMLLTGEPRTSQMLLSMMGPQEYGKALGGLYAPTDMQRMLRAAGVGENSPQGQQALLRAVAKANYIAPVEQRVDSVERDPNTNAVIGVNPQTPMGGINLYDQQGRFSGQSLAPGAAAAIEASQQAEAKGRTLGSPVQVPQKSGGAVPMLGANYPGFQNPGAPGAAPPPRPPPPLSPPPPPTPTQGMAPPGAPRPPAPNMPPAPAGAPPANPWARIPRYVEPSGPGAQSTTSAAISQEVPKWRAETSAELGKQSQLADTKQEYYAQAYSALNGAEAGPLSDWLTHSRASIAELFPSVASAIPGEGTVVPTTILGKNLGNAALNGARGIFPKLTQAEVFMQKNELSPSPAMVAPAVRALMAQDLIRGGYAKQMANDYRTKWVPNGGDPTPGAFESWYSSNFPLQGYAEQHIPEYEARVRGVNVDSIAAKIRQNPQLAPVAQKKYGFIPMSVEAMQ